MDKLSQYFIKYQQANGIKDPVNFRAKDISQEFSDFICKMAKGDELETLQFELYNLARTKGFDIEVSDYKSNLEDLPDFDAVVDRNVFVSYLDKTRDLFQSVCTLCTKPKVLSPKLEPSSVEHYLPKVKSCHSIRTNMQPKFLNHKNINESKYHASRMLYYIKAYENMLVIYHINPKSNFYTYKNEYVDVIKSSSEFNELKSEYEKFVKWHINSPVQMWRLNVIETSARNLIDKTKYLDKKDINSSRAVNI
ncbi:hypothetical protein G5Y06_004502 [Vibrio parahaemolyticus]|nr:hypothetical protein [Vibrio parahaemolyticus]